jgi:hypothetical protein
MAIVCGLFNEKFLFGKKYTFPKVLLYDKNFLLKTHL